MRYILQEWDAVMEYLEAIHDMEEIKKCDTTGLCMSCLNNDKTNRQEKQMQWP
jgi:hypothetical protein